MSGNDGPALSLPGQPGEGTLARGCCGLEVLSQVQSSSFIQAEKQREHLQPWEESWPWPCSPSHLEPIPGSSPGLSSHARVPPFQPPLNVQ